MNKHTIRITYLVLILISCAAASHAMQPQATVVPPLKLIQVARNIKTEFKQVLTQASLADQVVIYSDMFVFTDKEIYDPLLTIARKKESSISLHIHESNACNKNVIALFEKIATVKLKKSKQHGKRTMIKYKNKNENNWHRFVFEGSYNPSPNAANKNAELSLVTEQQRDYYRKHKASHKNGLDKPYHGDELLLDTPRAPEVCDTTQYDLCNSLALRVHPDQGGTLYLGTMGYNHAAFHAKLIAFLKARGIVHLLVDHASVNRVSQPLLKELREAGAHVMIGNMTSTKKNPRGTFHKKYFVRLPDNRVPNLVVIQSANFTKEAHSDFNHASYHPNAVQLGKDLITGHVNDVANAITLAELERRQAVEAAKPKRVQPARAAKKT